MESDEIYRALATVLKRSTDAEERSALSAGLLWDIEQPYLLRRETDGLCSHLDRKTQACDVYQNRPAACRTYDCRTDQRVWIDFEKRIPAPMPERLQGG